MMTLENTLLVVQKRTALDFSVFLFLFWLQDVHSVLQTSGSLCGLWQVGVVLPAKIKHCRLYERVFFSSVPLYTCLAPPGTDPSTVSVFSIIQGFNFLVFFLKPYTCMGQVCTSHP